MLYLDEHYVRRHLTYSACIPAMREAMIEFSSGRTRQLLRSILHLGEGRMFGVMPGGMEERKVFGAKLVSVFPENFALGKSSHQGVVVLFDSDDGAPVCVIDAASITAIRTAAASAAATDALARPDASTLALLGYGEQALTHARAIAEVRRIEEIRVWGRSPERAEAFVRRFSEESRIPVRAAPDAQAAVKDAQIICTVTSSKEPVLKGAWLSPGGHVNVVGSSYAGPVEVDTDLVRRSRFIADSRESVLAQGAEFLRAKEEGAIDDAHIVGEIGEVFLGKIAGRAYPDEITVYKSLGHVAQDLAAAALLYELYEER